MKRLAFVLIPLLLAAGPDLFHQKLDKSRQVEHALNRLTFGPRAGDVDAVSRQGLKKWVDEQLHPERIAEDASLTERLAKLDTLQMDTKTLVEKYPPNAQIRAMAKGNLPLPKDPEAKERIARLVERYKAREKGGAPTAEVDREKLRKVLTPAQMRTLARGTTDEKFAMLNALPPEKLDALVDALPQGRQRGLVGAAPVEMRRKLLASNAPQQLVATDLSEAKLLRAIYSKRQLEEVLVDFWYNHFNVYLDKGLDRVLTTSYERDAIRPHVLGKFDELLRATAEHPAMLFYLDNWQSVAADAAMARGRKRGLNENYARELLELHTMGVDNGYTQKDIVEVARCFTGWTMERPAQGGGFRYIDRLHDKGEKTVLGVKIAAGGGKEDALKVLDILAHRPETARFISLKLARRFVADDPPQQLVEAMAKTFTKTGGDIRQVMKTMIDSREFMSEGAYAAKMKTPLEFVVSAVRATGADVEGALALANQLQQLGQPLYKKVEPTGYSSQSEEWAGSSGLLARMNFAMALTGNKLPGVKVTVPGDAKEAGLKLGGPEFQKR